MMLIFRLILVLVCLSFQVHYLNAYNTNDKLPISVLMLAWYNSLSLNHTLTTFNNTGLFKMTSECVIFFNEINDRKAASVKEYPVHIIGSVYNVYIARSMQMLFSAAQYPYALFVEKDFSINIERSLVFSELQIAYDSIRDRDVDVYHLRSIEFPGNPQHAKSLFGGKEDHAVAANSLYVCTFSSWINNTAERWPHIFKHCGKHQVLCVKSAHCNWTNNPFMISVKFWIMNMMPAIQEMFKDHRYAPHQQHMHRSPHLIEPWINKEPHLWKNRNYTIGRGRGIFTHYEIDG